MYVTDDVVIWICLLLSPPCSLLSFFILSTGHSSIPALLLFPSGGGRGGLPIPSLRLPDISQSQSLPLLLPESEAPSPSPFRGVGPLLFIQFHNFGVAVMGMQSVPKLPKGFLG